VEADQTGRGVGSAARETGPGLGDQGGGAPDHDGEFVGGAAEPAFGPAGRAGQGAAGVAQYRLRLGRGPVGQAGQLPGDPRNGGLRLVAGLRVAQPQVRSDGPDPPPGGPGPVLEHCAWCGAHRLDPPDDAGHPRHRPGQEPAVGGVVNVRRHHGGVGADFSRLHHPGLHRRGQEFLVQRGDRLLAAAGGELHQCRRVRQPAVDVDAAEPPPRDRVGHLGAQRLVAEAVAVLEEHQPQIRLHRDRRAAHPGGEMRDEWREKPFVVQPGVDPFQLGGQPQADLRQYRLPQRRLHVPRPKHDRNPLRPNNFLSH
jgi:hypothetical protein